MEEIETETHRPSNSRHSKTPTSSEFMRLKELSVCFRCVNGSFSCSIFAFGKSTWPRVFVLLGGGKRWLCWNETFLKWLTVNLGGCCQRHDAGLMDHKFYILVDWKHTYQSEDYLAKQNSKLNALFISFV